MTWRTSSGSSRSQFFPLGSGVSYGIGLPASGAGDGAGEGEGEVDGWCDAGGDPGFSGCELKKLNKPVFMLVEL